MMALSGQGDKHLIVKVLRASKIQFFGNLYSLARIDEHKGLAARAVGYLFKQVFNALEATKRLQLLKHLFSNFVRGHASPLAKSLAKWTIPVEMEL